jgi:DNA-binding MarR family transcriptional regulator
MDGGDPLIDADDELAIPTAFRDVIGYHLRIAQDASFHAIRQGALDGAIKPGWYTILTILHDSPGLTPGALSRSCGRDRSTLTGTLKDLSASGLITRRRNASDQRSYSVRLTPNGTAMLDRMRAHAAHHDARLDAIVGEHKPLLLTLLRRIASQLRQDEPKQEPEDTP